MLWELRFGCPFRAKRRCNGSPAVAVAVGIDAAAVKNTVVCLQARTLERSGRAGVAGAET